MAKKLYYKIGEACRDLEIQPYVLRYWETEFPFLRPDKSSSGQRVYTEDELRLIGRIKELLYDEGYTIAGAKKKLEQELEAGLPPTSREVESAGPVEDPEPVVHLDSSGNERIETIARGLRELHAEAREILGLVRRSAQ